MTPMAVSSVAAIPENAVRAHEPEISTALRVIARLSMAAATLSLAIAAAFSLIVWGAFRFNTSDGDSAAALVLAVTGLVSGGVFLRVKRD
jgi:hypothetical protein